MYTMKQTLLLGCCLIGLFLFNSSSCERCEEIEPSINIRFVDAQSGQSMLPNFQSVREISMNDDLNFNPTRIIYLNLNADKVTYLFTSDSLENEVDTLTISYSREVDYLNDSYCMKLGNENLELSTFSNDTQFDITNYEITIYN